MNYKAILAALGLFILTMIVAMYAVSWSPSYQDCKAASSNDSGEHKKPDANYFVRRVTYGDSTSIDCESAFANANGGAISALASALLGFVTAGLVWLGWLQLVTNRTQLRAQVFPKGFLQWWLADTPVKGQYSWKFRPNWENSGDTPAEQMMIVIECEVRNQMLPADYDFGAALATRTPVRGLLAPKTTLGGGLAPVNSSVSPQDILDAQKGQKYIYLYGRVQYWDVFPGTRQHVTHFCWLVLVTGDPLTFVPNNPTHALTFNYVMHSEGNFTEDI